MRLTFSTATDADAGPIAALRTATANHLTEQYGHGPWSAQTTDKGVRLMMRTSRVLVSRHGTEIVGTLCLTTKKPWSQPFAVRPPSPAFHLSPPGGAESARRDHVLSRSQRVRVRGSTPSIVKRPLYLLAMAVAPNKQRQGIGRRLLKEAATIARAWPAEAGSAKVGAIRLDSYDADAGAGPFYAKCGFREVGRETYRKAPLIYFELVL